MAINADFKCVVSADLFRRAMMAQSTEETRYYLNGVHIEPCPEGGALLVATDGHRLLVFRDEHGYVEGGSAIIKLSKGMVKALSAKPWQHPGWAVLAKSSDQKRPHRRFLAVHGDKAATIDFGLDPVALMEVETAEMIVAQVDDPSPLVGGFQWIDTQIDGAFPDWRRVIGEPGEGGALAPVNLSVLRPVVQALSQDGVEGGYRLAPTKDDPEGPMYVIPSQSVPGFGIIMPMRSTQYGQKFSAPPAPKVPSWLSRPAQAEAA